MRPTSPVRRRWPLAVVTTACIVGVGLVGGVWASVAPSENPPDRSEGRLVEIGRIDGRINPKSIVHSGNGLFFAQNVMYRHSMTVYDRNLEQVADISDQAVVDGRSEPVDGSPVEIAFTADGSKAYVSNYQMYGPGFDNPGDDDCDEGPWDPSYVYRVDVDSFEIDQTIGVGSVPKAIAVSDDDRLAVVTNWCSFSLSVINTARGEEIAEVPIGRHPRGVAIHGTKAYVAVTGGRDIAVVDLVDYEVEWIADIGSQPRHLVIDHDRGFLYASLNGDGEVLKLDLADHTILDRAATGTEPRTIALSDDGSSLYVVNYGSDTLAKVRTSDMAVLQHVDTEPLPIGVTVDAATGNVWVSSYIGTITVFHDRLDVEAETEAGGTGPHSS